MKLKRADIPSDLPLLAEMNQQLIQDSGHRNPMTLPELQDRMLSFLSSDYTAVLFILDEKQVGYALFQPREDDLYIRQFFVRRAHRREGVGKKAFNVLKSEILPPEKRLVLSVLCQNSIALEFWRSVGFQDYCHTLEMLPEARAEL